MRILILVPHQNQVSGNWVTAKRFQAGLEKQGHQVSLHDTCPDTRGDLKQHLRAFSPDISILLHAYRTGKTWLDEAEKERPFLVLLTGTDVNQGLDDPQQSAVIRTVMNQAASVLLQNPLIFNHLKDNHPELSGNLQLLVPGITLGEKPYAIRTIHQLPREETLFLCPAGLRPVKGVLPLLNLFDQVAREKVQLAFCGPILDEEYGSQVLAAVDERPWAHYLGAIAPDAMASAMRGADVIVNNSRTEGLANSLLEATSLGIPILVRNIPGNAAIVEPEVNGLMYADEVEFAQQVRRLLCREERANLACPALQRYHPDKETACLLNLLQQALNESSTAPGQESQKPDQDPFQDPEADRAPEPARRA